MTRAEGFEPVFDGSAKLLILGSFPSVKSRAVQFYYGNPQNRFWRTVCGFFHEEIPASADGKRAFLLRRHIALWDVVVSCEIVGSSDASIRGEKIADVGALLRQTGIQRVFCNGSAAFALLKKYFPAVEAKRLSSTSPANPRFSAEEWTAALREVFPEND